MADIPSSLPGFAGAERDAADDPEADPRVIGVDGDDADAVLAALSSTTARSILSALHEGPGPASDVAGRVDTSLQNAQYHLKRLRGAGVVEVVDTVYSEKGREMDVYAPADGPLVLVAGPESEADGVRATLARLLGGVGAVGLGAAVVEFALDGPFAPSFGLAAGGGSADGADVATSTEGGAGASGADATTTAAETAAEAATETAAAATRTPAPTAEPTAADLATEAAASAAAGPSLLDQLAASPGFLFLCGGLLALALVAVYARRRGAL